MGGAAVEKISSCIARCGHENSMRAVFQRSRHVQAGMVFGTRVACSAMSGRAGLAVRAGPSGGVARTGYPFGPDLADDSLAANALAALVVDALAADALAAAALAVGFLLRCETRCAAAVRDACAHVLLPRLACCSAD